MSNFSQYFYLLESPNAETKDDESQLVALLCGDVLDGDQHRAQVGICSVKVEMFPTFQSRPVVESGLSQHKKIKIKLESKKEFYP